MCKCAGGDDGRTGILIPHLHVDLKLDHLSRHYCAGKLCSANNPVRGGPQGQDLRTLGDIFRTQHLTPAIFLQEAQDT
jgi:hypothetical protein